jgi:multiple sugar transport system permease protein
MNLTVTRAERPVARSTRSNARAFGDALLFIAPSLFGVTVFLVIPVIAVIVLSFFNWNLLAPATFAGVQNYIDMFRFEHAAHSLAVTGYYVLLNIPAEIVLALCLAIILNRRRPGMGIYRVLFVAPYMSTPVAMGIIWYWVFDPRLGLVNHLLGLVGIQGPAWLSSSTWAMPVVAAVNVWQFVGFNTLFFLAGLQAIPTALYEAAALDGGGAWSQFWSITRPLLNSTLLFVLVTNVIGALQVFDTLYVLTQGGPGNSTEVMSLSIYQTGFINFRLGEAASLSVLLFGVILAFSIGQFIYFRNRTTYDYSV